MLNTYPCNPFPISSEQLHKGDNEDLQAQINAIKDGNVIDSFGDVETALDTKADNDVIAPEFDAEAGTYEIGDLVMYEGKLYEFTSAHETAGEWNPTEVTDTTVCDELSSLESGLTDLTDHVDGDATTYPYADVITINDAVPANLAGCMVKIEPVQSGTGTPSPTNVRPITGHTEAVVTVADDDTDPTVTNTYTLALGDTIYGGTVDFKTGVMTVDRAMLTINGTEQGWSADTTSGGKRRFTNEQLLSLGYTSTANISASSNLFKNTTSHNYDLMDNVFILRYINSTNRIDIMTEQFADVTEFTTYLTSNNMQVLYQLATPFTVQLTPQQIQLLQGTNTLYASTGDISVTVNGVSGAIGAVQKQVNATDAVLAELAADIAEQLPTAPTTDGTYTLAVTVADGTPAYSWVSGS